MEAASALADLLDFYAAGPSICSRSFLRQLANAVTVSRERWRRQQQIVLRNLLCFLGTRVRELFMHSVDLHAQG